METLFENEDFILKSTGHDYDFIGIIETKCDEPLTFFFSEEYVPHNIEDEDDWDSDDFEDNVDENETKFLDVYKGLKEYTDETQTCMDDGLEDDDEVASSICADSYFRTRDDKSTGFLSNPRERGQFLALVKEYCPDKLSSIEWAE